MKQYDIALAAAALVAAALPSSAQAHCRGCGAAVGVIGGIAAGAIIGSAIANSQPRYVEPAPVYGVPPADYVDAPEDVDGPVCHVENRKIWVAGYGYRTRRIEICESFIMPGDSDRIIRKKSPPHVVEHRRGRPAVDLQAVCSSDRRRALSG